MAVERDADNAMGRPVFAFIGAILAALLALAVYWPALDNGLVWDDWPLLGDVPLYRDPASWREALLTPPLGDPATLRPLAMLSYLSQLWAGQTTPASFHLVNIAIHAANVFLLVLVAWHFLAGAVSRSWMRTMAAVLCGLVYGVHPGLIEPVVWISCRYDLLATFFLLLALLLDMILPKPGWNRALAIAAAFLAAMLSKETAAGFLLALPFVHLAAAAALVPVRPGVTRSALVSNRRVYAALICASLLYLAGRLAVAGPTLGMDTMVSRFDGIGGVDQRFLAALTSLAQLAVSAFWPFFDIVPSRSLQLPVSPMEAARWIAPAAGLVGAGALALRAGPAGAKAGLLVLAFLAASLPVANILPTPAPTDELWVATRYLTFPLVFVCLAGPFGAGVAGTWLAKRFGGARGLLGAIAVLWIAASVANVRVTIPLWRDDAVLNSWAIAQAGPKYWRYSNLGLHYLRIDDYERAHAAFTTAAQLRADKHSAFVWNNLGIVEAALGQLPRAAAAFQRALELDPEAITPRTNLARLARRAGDLERARALLEEGVRKAPNSAGLRKERRELHLELGLTYAELAMPEAAMAQYTAALDLSRGQQEHEEIRAAMRRVSARG
jgi:hypothetical protein